MHGMLMLVAGSVTIIAGVAAVMIGCFAIGYAIGAVLTYMF